MENFTKAETSGTFIFLKDAESQNSDVWEGERKFKKEKEFKRLSSSYAIMTINMNGKSEKGQKEIQHRRRKLITSTIKDSPASVIFCQEVPGFFEKEVVKKCGSGSSSYEFVRSQNEVAVMWHKADFQGQEVTDYSIKKIADSLEKVLSVDVSEIIRTRTAMVKLTSKTTKVSFLAVSWHGPWKSKLTKPTKLKVLNGLDCFLCEVCRKENLSSFIVGGDFNLNTDKVTVNPTQYERVTISRYKLCARDQKKVKQKKCGRPFTPYKDTFIVSNTLPSDKHLMAVDITVPEVKPFEPKNESSENPLLDHVPVLGVFKLVWPYKKQFIKQGRGKLEQHLRSR